MRRLAVLVGIVASGCNAQPGLSLGSATSESTGGETTSTGGQTTPGAPGCGNGIVEEGEECDLGFANDDEKACKEDCTLQRCGDGFKGPEEECDDGNTEGGDDCPGDCIFPLEQVWSHANVDGSPADIALGPDGNLVVVGSVWAGANEHDATAWIRKLDPDGNEIWSVTYDGHEQSGASAAGVAVSPQGDVFVAGQSYPADTNYGEAWLGRYRPDGDQAWSWIRDDTGFDDGFAEVVVGDDGHLYLAGSHGAAPAKTDAMVMKVDPEGTSLADATLWEHIHVNPDRKFDLAWDVVVHPGNEVTAVGSVAAAGGAGVMNTVIWMRRLDAAGQEIWTVTRQGEAGEIDEGRGGAALASGGVVAVGFLTTQGTLAEPDTVRMAMWVGAFDKEGNELWSQTLEADQPGEQQARDVAVDEQGNLLIVGVTPVPTPGCDHYTCPRNGTIWAHDNDGILLWEWHEPVAVESRFDVAAFDDEGRLYVGGYATAPLATRGGVVRKYRLR